MSNIISSVEYNNSASIGFFGDSFSRAIVKIDENRQVELSEIGSSETLGESKISLSFDNTNKAYYINIDRVLTNIEIELEP